MTVTQHTQDSQDSTAARTEQGSYLSHRQILVVLFGVMAGMLLAALDQSIVGTALPRIVSDLGGLDKLSWVVTAYLLTSTAAVPLWGKISDLYGRRLIFQVCICIFLVGSFLCGLTKELSKVAFLADHHLGGMTVLIVFRALQGIGGGGLFAIALSIIGDVIPPRERGRYQGYFGAVFGISSVAGPLLGGFFTDGPGWEWIFYVNIPIGLGALVVTSVALKMPVVRREHKIDYAGAAVIVCAVASLLLYLTWAGKDYGWFSWRPLLLVAATVLLTALFVAVEQRADEPIIPLRLFRNSVFTISNIYGFLAGVAMFGAIIFLPVYLQGVLGMSPTMSGLALLPAVVGIFLTSISSGQLITKTGRYKIYPIAGAAILIVSLLLLSRLRVDTPYWQVAVDELIFGSGLGLTMQTIVTAVQNSVDMRDMGAATSSTTFFRQMGGAIGTAALGATLTSRLTTHLAQAFAGRPVPPSSAGGPKIDPNNIQALQKLAEPLKTIALTAFSKAMDDVFLIAVPFIIIALVASLFLKEIPLRTGQAPGAPDVQAADLGPKPAGSARR